MKFKVPWRLVYDEANRAVLLALCNSINSSESPKTVGKASDVSFTAVIAPYIAYARAILEEIRSEKPFLDTELEEKLRAKKRESVRLKLPFKLWTVFDVFLVLLLFGLSGCGMLIEWNAMTQLLMQAEPLKHRTTLSGLLSSGLVLMIGALAKFQCPDIRENYLGNKRYQFALFLISILASLAWLLCFATRNTDAPLNSLATQLMGQVISSSDEHFESRLFLIQTVSQSIGAATVAAWLFSKAENVLRTHRRRKNLRNETGLTSIDVGLDDIQARHRSLVGAAAQAQAVLDEIPARKQSFVLGWITQTEAAMEAKAALEDIIGPFTIVPKDR